METLQENFIDVTLIKPKLKQATIFDVFDRLNCCESLMIRNDFDPKPVYYQLLAEKGDVFTWQYVRKGPEIWKVIITKIHEDRPETLGEIAVKDLRKVAVFKKYGIDLCYGGNKTVSEVCTEKNIAIANVEAELQQVDGEVKVSNIAYNDWGIDFLADYILNTHHSYALRYSPELLGYAIKVAQVHGKRHPELLKIKELVTEIHEELATHLSKSENVLFPYIKKLVSVKKSNRTTTNEEDSIEKLIEASASEHDFVGNCSDEIKRLSNRYTIPDDACASYKLLFKMLEEFEHDLHIHIHLENNILFPKAIAMEKSLTA